VGSVRPQSDDKAVQYALSYIYAGTYDCWCTVWGILMSLPQVTTTFLANPDPPLPILLPHTTASAPSPLCPSGRACSEGKKAKQPCYANHPAYPKLSWLGSFLLAKSFRVQLFALFCTGHYVSDYQIDSMLFSPTLIQGGLPCCQVEKEQKHTSKPVTGSILSDTPFLLPSHHKTTTDHHT
jgi:hypothetical protein